MAQQWQYLTAFVHGGKVGGIDDVSIQNSPYHDVKTEMDFLYRVGKDGWELIAVVGGVQAGAYKLYFKRP